MRATALTDVPVTNLMAHPPRGPSRTTIAMELEGLGLFSEAKPTTGGYETRARVLTPRGSAAANVG